MSLPNEPIKKLRIEIDLSGSRRVAKEIILFLEKAWDLYLLKRMQL